MRLITLATAVALLTAASMSSATTCYVVFDRNDAVVYRDIKPPFDLSDLQSKERELMRSRGQHLLVAEFGEVCYPVGFISPTTGANTATVDEIVSGLRPAMPANVAAIGGAPVIAPANGSSAPADAPGK